MTATTSPITEAWLDLSASPTPPAAPVRGENPVAPSAHVEGKWRVFEDVSHGWWGIEIDGDEDADPVLYPIKTRREKLDRIVDVHNAGIVNLMEAK